MSLCIEALSLIKYLVQSDHKIPDNNSDSSALSVVREILQLRGDSPSQNILKKISVFNKKAVWAQTKGGKTPYIYTHRERN